jgi:hypothetical protein
VESQDNDDLIAVEQLEGIYTFANKGLVAILGFVDRILISPSQSRESSITTYTLEIVAHLFGNRLYICGVTV